MLAGVVISAITGGLAGLGYAAAQDHGLVQTLLSYQIGGMMAVLAFVTMGLRSLPHRP